MIKVEIIGNLGADAQLQEKNGNKFVAFRVANTDKWVDKSTGQVIESTQWISCTLNGDGGALLPYLKGVRRYLCVATPNLLSFPAQKPDRWKSVLISSYEKSNFAAVQPHKKQRNPKSKKKPQR